MNTQEKNHTTIASGLRAGRTVSEIVNLHNLSKSTVKRVKRWYEAFLAGGGVPEDFETMRKDHKRRSDTLDDAIVAESRSSSTRTLAGR
jgi:hypothetical protein